MTNEFTSLSFIDCCSEYNILFFIFMMTIEFFFLFSRNYLDNIFFYIGAVFVTQV